MLIARAAASAQPNSEQSLQALVKEVHQLRIEVRRWSVATQGNVIRLARELNEVRERAHETTAKRQKLQVLIQLIEKEVEDGVKSRKEVEEMKAELKSFVQSR